GQVTGAGGLNKVGAGTLVLTTADSYTGPTQVVSGTLAIQSGGALGTSPLGTTVVSGATLDLQGNLTVATPLNLSGTGVGGIGVLHSASGNQLLTGKITLSTADVTVGID